MRAFDSHRAARRALFGCLLAVFLAHPPRGLANTQVLPSDYAWPKATRVPTEPAIRIPDHFKNAHEVMLPKSRMTMSSSGGTWWKIFGDPTLDTLEAQALLGNQDLAVAVANIMESREHARATAADFFPHLSVPLSAERQQTTGNGPITQSRIVGSGFPLASLPAGGGSVPDTFAGQTLQNTYSTYQGSLLASYELDVFGRIRHTYGEARADAQASEADRNSVALSLSAEVAANYFALRAVDSQIVVLRDTVDLRKESLSIQKQRLDSGHASQLEVAQAEVELDNAESDLTDAARARGEQENALAALCGQPAGDFAIPQKPLTLSSPPEVPGVVPSALLRQRPDIVEAERKVAADSEGIGAARAEFFPTINLQGEYGTDSAYFDELARGDSNTWSFGISINVPIFEGGRNAANLKAAKARRDASVASYQQTTITAFKEVETALIDLRQRALQSEIRARAVESAQKVFHYSRDRYQEGAINYFDVIEAERSLLTAQLSQVQTLDARYAATIDLIRAIGGAYPTPSTERTSVNKP